MSYNGNPSRNSLKGSISHRFSREGFEPLNRGQKDVTVDIPMQQVNGQAPVMANDLPTTAFLSNEKHELPYSRAGQGVRRSINPGLGHQRGNKGYDGEEDAITKMGLVYNKILNFSLITRYLIYYVPVAILIAIPIIIGATAAKGATLGDVRIVWIFVWMECAWAGLWVSKIFARWLPSIFQALCGIVSSGTRKYSLIIKALEIPLSLAGWALVSLATFLPIMTRNPDTRAGNARKAANNEDTSPPHWQYIIQRILAAALIAALVYLGEKAFIQIISINYHRKQFTARINASKRNIYLLSLLYDASRSLFPAYCPEFVDEDSAIADNFDFRRNSKRRSGGSATPMRFIRDVGRVGDKLTAAFGNVAKEVTGKPIFNPDSAHSVVVTALEKNKSAEALAKRLWLSFVIEGNDALYQEDVIEVLGAGHETEAQECFASLDRDGNGDVSLDEMILTVTEFGRERHSVANSMHDVDQAIGVLDTLLCIVVSIVVIFVFVAFLNTSFVTTLATAGTALLSLSFVFATSAQELLGSSIFLFVKHPFDIGDRVDINTDQFVVEQISLLFTVFRRVTNHRTVQIPNIVLNTLWIENVSRSKAMREQLSVFVSFDTTLEDVQLLKTEMQQFVLDKENSRDFQPDIEIEVLGIAEMNKLELRIEILHKSNWSNETVRAARRSKFMCALVLALRKVPIYGPGGGDAALGTNGNPSYSVTVSDTEAGHKRDVYATEKEAKRFVPTKKAAPSEGDLLAAPTEQRAINTLNERSPALDGTRDDDVSVRTLDRAGVESQDIEEVRGILRRATTKGKRKSAKSLSDRSIRSIEEGMSSGSAMGPPKLNLITPSPIAQTYTTRDDSMRSLPRMNAPSPPPPMPAPGRWKQ